MDKSDYLWIGFNSGQVKWQWSVCDGGRHNFSHCLDKQQDMLYIHFTVTRRKPGITHLWGTCISPWESDTFGLKTQRLSREGELCSDFHYKAVEDGQERTKGTRANWEHINTLILKVVFRILLCTNKASVWDTGWLITIYHIVRIESLPNNLLEAYSIQTFFKGKKSCCCFVQGLWPRLSHSKS